MADPKFDSYDKHIQELIQIRLGLQDRSNQIFKELLNDSKNDPLDDIFKAILRKNQKIRQQTIKIMGLQKIIKQKGLGSPLKQTQYRSKSLPQDHQKNLKQIEGKKKDLANRKQIYSQKVQSFIIFLMKCLRQISKTKFQDTRDVEKSITDLEKKLIKEKNRVLQIQQSRQGMQPFKTFSETTKTTKNVSNQQQNLQKLIKQIKESKNHEQVFGKIHEKLGLAQQWNRYNNRLKAQSQLFYLTKSLIFAEDKFRGTITEQNRKYQEQIKNKKIQLRQFVDNLLIQVKKQVSENSMQNSVNQIFESEKLKLQDIPNDVHNLFYNTILYFYKKLDSFFERHNQNPYTLTSREEFKNFAIRTHQLFRNKFWKEAFEVIKTQINDAFYCIDRKTKFYSSNRVITRNKY